MKTGKLLLMVLVVLLGTAVAAPAVTIHSPPRAGTTRRISTIFLPPGAFLG